MSQQTADGRSRGTQLRRELPHPASLCSLALCGQGDHRPLGTDRLAQPARPWGCEGAGAALTHVMVSIMSSPISTQQWAWSVLGWVRPDTQ